MLFKFHNITCGLSVGFEQVFVRERHIIFVWVTLITHNNMSHNNSVILCGLPIVRIVSSLFLSERMESASPVNGRSSKFTSNNYQNKWKERSLWLVSLYRKATIQCFATIYSMRREREEYSIRLFSDNAKVLGNKTRKQRTPLSAYPLPSQDKGIMCEYGVVISNV